MQEVIITNKKTDYLSKLAECEDLIFYSKTGKLDYFNLDDRVRRDISSLDLEILYADTRDYAIAYALSRCTGAKFLKIETEALLNKNKHYIFISEHAMSDNLDSLIMRLSIYNITYLVAYDLEALSVLIAKFLYPNKILGKTNMILNMLDSSIKDISREDFQIVNRKGDVFEKLCNLKEINYLSAIVHGNGNLLYLGQEKLVSKAVAIDSGDTILANFLDSKRNKVIFLASCFGTMISGKSYLDDLMKSNVDTIITYRGLKENGYSECTWFILLNYFGFQYDEIVRIINKNLKNKTVDVPRYNLIGSSENILKVSPYCEYSFEGNHISCHTENANRFYFGKCKLPLNYEQFALSYKERISWIIEDGYIYLMGENSFLPKRIDVVTIPKESVVDFGILSNTLSLNGGLNKSLKNLMGEVENLSLGLSQMTEEFLCFTDKAEKYQKKLANLEQKRSELIESFLNEIITSKQTTYSPLSEKYSMHFSVSDISTIENRCPYCNFEITRKVLKKTMDSSYKRIIFSCNNCGQIQDLGNMDKLINVDIENSIEDNKTLKINIKLHEFKGLVRCGIGLITNGILPPVITKKCVGNDEIQFLFESDLISVHNLIKVYLFYENNLFIISKPYRKETE